MLLSRNEENPHKSSNNLSMLANFALLLSLGSGSGSGSPLECQCEPTDARATVTWCNEMCTQGAPDLVLCRCNIISVTQPQGFALMLKQVVAGADCSQAYDVHERVFGTLANDGDFLDGRGVQWPLEGGAHGVALAWLSDHAALQTFLTDSATGCCGADVTTLAQCKCRIGVSVGIWPNVAACRAAETGEPGGVPMTYWGLIPEKTPNDTLVPRVVSPKDSVYVTAPNWANVVAALPYTFAPVFRSAGGGSAAGTFVPPRNCTAGERATLVAELKAFLSDDGADTWEKAVASDPATAAALGASAGPNGVRNVTVARFAQLLQSTAGAALCTNAMAVRTYLWYALDANSEFLGTGFDASGDPEYVTMLNPKLASIGAKTELFGLPMQD